MFDRRHACIGQHLLGVVVDELAVDEEVRPVRHNFGTFVGHLLLFRRLDLAHFGHGVDAHARAVDLDLVRVHRRVGDEDLGVLDPLRVPYVELLVQDEPLVQERVLETAAGLLDELDHFQVAGSLEAQHGVHCELGEVVLVVREDLRTQGGACDVHEIALERGIVRLMVHGDSLERHLSHCAGLAVALDDGHGVHLLVDELLGLTQQFTSEHDHRCGAVAHFIVLRLGNVH
mmetsp:Transcript_46684/g.74682  ORF Transcript_46684/g.74682 Transcript_46684/m.74682 type:complete len:231 (-) Transcript_46684:59-751(-)